MLRNVALVGVAALFALPIPAQAQSFFPQNPSLPTFTFVPKTVEPLLRMPEAVLEKHRGPIWIERTMSADLVRQHGSDPWRVIPMSGASQANAIDCAMVKKHTNPLFDAQIVKPLPTGVEFKTPTLVPTPCKR